MNDKIPKTKFENCYCGLRIVDCAHMFSKTVRRREQLHHCLNMLQNPNPMNLQFPFLQLLGVGTTLSNQIEGWSIIENLSSE